MNRPIKILLQTSIAGEIDDWSIARFSLLAQLLRNHRGADGISTFEVTARDREPAGVPDSVLSTLDDTDFDEMWLFAVDEGNGLTAEDCSAISRFRRSGRGLLVTRDHMDVGSSVCALEGVGLAHHFHTRNVVHHSLRVRDDPYSAHIDWPNYHSGANGDYQTVIVRPPLHPVLANPSSATRAIRYLPAHPHEGAVGAPVGHDARVIASGISLVTGADFNLAVAFEAGDRNGRAIAQSTFHHFADYNWDTRMGSPTFVGELPSDAIMRAPQALADAHRYALNVALWLVGEEPRSYSACLEVGDTVDAVQTPWSGR